MGVMVRIILCLLLASATAARGEDSEDLRRELAERAAKEGLGVGWIGHGLNFFDFRDGRVALRPFAQVTKWYKASPDGSRIVATIEGRRPASVVTDLTGRILWRLNRPMSTTDPALSPDGTRIAFSSIIPDRRIRGLFVAELDSQEVTELAVAPSGFGWNNLSWSADGREIVYSSRWKIYIRDVSSNAERLLTAGNAPQWSPDGHFIAYFHDGEARLIRPDGSESRPLGPDIDGPLRWSPDSQYILCGQSFSAIGARGSKLTIYRLRDGATVRYPMFMEDFNQFHWLVMDPAPSPPAEVAVKPGPGPDLAARDSDDFRRELAQRAIEAGLSVGYVDSFGYHLFDLRLGRRLATRSFAQKLLGRTFFADGKRIAAALYPAGPPGEEEYFSPLVVTDLEGKILRRLDFKMGGGPLALSPDGNRIVISGSRPSNPANPRSGAQYGLFLADLDHQQVRKLAIQEGPLATPHLSLSWSADGHQIVYERDRKIYIRDIDTNTERFLIYGQMPDWSPDGRYIVFRGLDFATYLITPDGSELMSLLPGRIVDGLRWSPDSRYLMFDDVDGSLGTESRLAFHRMKDGAVVHYNDWAAHYQWLLFGPSR